jgi:hypothetical protein
MLQDGLAGLCLSEFDAAAHILCFTRNERGAEKWCKLWQYVIPHFEKFLTELQLKFPQRVDAMSKAERVAKSLHAKYYPGQAFNANCYINAGSFGKGTAIRPPSDVDLVFHSSA